MEDIYLPARRPDSNWKGSRFHGVLAATKRMDQCREQEGDSVCCLYIHPSTQYHLYINPSIFISIHPPVYPSTQFQPSIYQPIQLFTHSSTHLITHLSIYPSFIHLQNNSSIHPSIHLPIIHPSTHPSFTYLLIYPSSQPGFSERYISYTF